MSGDFGDGRWLQSWKNHKCSACFGVIPRGERHYHFKGMWEGEWQNWRMHIECFTGYESSGEYEFMPGDSPIPERIKRIEL